MLPKQVIDYNVLLGEGMSKGDIANLSASLRIFPTPFKGIYYIPMKEELRGAFIENPKKALSTAIAIHLGSRNFYYSCAAAEEFLGISWQPSGEVHVVNEAKSGKIDIAARIERNAAKKTYRAKKIAEILSFYGKRIIFHKVKDIRGAKFRETPYGRFALKSQIGKDRRRFHRRRSP